jgi:hypothetical protein
MDQIRIHSLKFPLLEFIVESSSECDYGKVLTIYHASILQISKRGTGKQQLRVGLGMSTLVIAKESLRPVRDTSCHWCYEHSVNPVTEPLARVRFLPLTLVFISLYPKRPFTVKLKFVHGPTILLELADRDREVSFPYMRVWCGDWLLLIFNVVPSEVMGGSFFNTCHPKLTIFS